MNKDIMALNEELNVLRGGQSAATFFTENAEVKSAMAAIHAKIAKIQRADDVALMDEAESFGLMDMPMSGVWQRLSDSERNKIVALIEDRRANQPKNDGVNLCRLDLE